MMKPMRFDGFAFYGWAQMKTPRWKMRLEQTVFWLVKDELASC